MRKECTYLNQRLKLEKKVTAVNLWKMTKVQATKFPLNRANAILVQVSLCDDLSVDSALGYPHHFPLTLSFND